MSDINTILINAGISSGIFILYKVINHYRLKSSCNDNNELVISVVDINTEKNIAKQQDIAIEIKESPEIVPTKPTT